MTDEQELPPLHPRVDELTALVGDDRFTDPEGSLRALMVDTPRQTFDLELANDMLPTLSSDDVKFVRNLRDSPGGFDHAGTWLLPSGLPLTGEEIAQLPDELLE